VEIVDYCLVGKSRVSCNRRLYRPILYIITLQQFDLCDCSRQFFIVSELNGMVLDIKGASRVPGSKVVIAKRRLRSHDQLWHLDANGYIRSSFTDFALEAHCKYLIFCVITS